MYQTKCKHAYPFIQICTPLPIKSTEAQCILKLCFSLTDLNFKVCKLCLFLICPQKNLITLKPKEFSFFTGFFRQIFKTFCNQMLVVMGRTMFDVQSSFVRRQKLGVRVRLLTNEHVQCSFDVRSTVRRTFNEHRKQNLSIL